MLGGPNLKIDAGTPSLAQGIDGRPHHTGEGLDTVEFAKRRCRQNCLDGCTQGIVINGSRKAASQPGCQLLEGHDLQAVLVLTSRG